MIIFIILYSTCGTDNLEFLSSVSGGIRAGGQVGTTPLRVCRLPACYAHYWVAVVSIC